ncbi:MAG: type II toxin-antitoxin system HicB family antitoxin [Bryobacterales bacterium]|nr:type II toxin-antitoxin system HicB family antitoxin [Bryobacterales bacterium]MDE0295479.1 type II toxin-antitoxin system HicB family antitoxin [Bryobacterales bacterium]
MNRQLTAIVEREGDGYVALCPEVDVASQGDTVTEARDNLTEALSLFFETASAEEAEEMDRRLRSEVYVTRVEVAIG